MLMMLMMTLSCGMIHDGLWLLERCPPFNFLPRFLWKLSRSLNRSRCCPDIESLIVWIDKQQLKLMKMLLYRLMELLKGLLSFGALTTCPNVEIKNLQNKLKHNVPWWFFLSIFAIIWNLYNVGDPHHNLVTRYMWGVTVSKLTAAFSGSSRKSHLVNQH